MFELSKQPESMYPSHQIRTTLLSENHKNAYHEAC